MTFVSLAFLFFLPIVFVLYWALDGNLKWQNLFLLFASYVFYGWWDYRFLVLVLMTSVSSYACGILLNKCQEQMRRKGMLLFNVVLNMGILACFKYFSFFVESFAAITEFMGVGSYKPVLYVILPVGISFYTFQSLSYVIDVYRGKMTATTDGVAFLAYVSFFPQLVAGPIERATDLLPQLLNRRMFKYEEAVDGMRQMLWGFFKKMVVADNCALAVNEVWHDWESASGVMLLMGMLLFTFQIYCDFSGYSDIAIGTARLFGIKLSDNFRYPYFSRSVAEFWRRWHVTLMSWFRDYVYIPLGGSRCGKWLTIRNIFIVFSLSGLWHGANWTFVMWGLYNAILLMIPMLLNQKHEVDKSVVQLRDWPKVLLTFILISIGWVIFRADTLTDGVGYIERMVSMLPSISVSDLVMGKTALLWCAFLVVVEWLVRQKRHALQSLNSGMFKSTVLRWGVYYAILIAILLFHGQEQTFIYFQF